MQPMTVVAVGHDQHGRPLLVLREAVGRRRVLPVWIGEVEASAIAAERRHLVQARPRTHALIAGVISACGGHLDGVSITDLREDTFFAELVLDRGTRISARVSDAVALALHLGVPIQAADSVLEDAGLGEDAVQILRHGQPREAEDSDDQQIARLRQFLDTASPEDFDTDPS